MKIRSAAAFAIRDRLGHARNVDRQAVRLRESGEDRAVRVVPAHEFQKAVVGAARVDRDQAGGDPEGIHLARTVLEDVGERPLVGVVLRDDVIDEVRLHADGDEILHDARELVGDRQRLNLCAGDLRGRRTVQRFRPLTRLVQHLRVQGANRAPYWA